MNVFTTEHPMAAQPSLLDAKTHPFLFFVFSSLLLALLLTPLILYGLYQYAMSDIGADNPFPEPGWALLMGSILAFVLILFCACPLLLIFRIVARIWQHRKPVALRFFIFIVFLTVVTGCRHPANTSQRLTPLPPDSSAYRTPTNLANQIAGADLIIVTNNESYPIELQHVGFSLNGDKAREIGLAISSGRHYDAGSIPSGILWEWEIRFYKGTTFIVAVPFEGRTFMGDGRFLYDDESGALDKVYREVLRLTKPPDDK